MELRDQRRLSEPLSSDLRQLSCLTRDRHEDRCGGSRDPVQTSGSKFKTNAAGVVTSLLPGTGLKRCQGTVVRTGPVLYSLRCDRPKHGSTRTGSGIR